MTIPWRTVLVATTLTVFASLISIGPTGAQEPAGSKAVEPVAKKKHDPARRVPPYFGQIGLTTEQRTNIYGILTKRYEKIDALEAQIATEKAEMITQCEGALTETQKKLLDNLRRAAAEPAPAKSAEPAKVSK